GAVATARAAYEERQRLESLVKRPRTDQAGQPGRHGVEVPGALLTATAAAGASRADLALAAEALPAWLPEAHEAQEARGLVARRLGAGQGPSAASRPEPVAAVDPNESRHSVEIIGGEWDDEPDVDWRLPPIGLLDSVSAKKERMQEEIKRNVRIIE